jgi:hypothetical protein
MIPEADSKAVGSDWDALGIDLKAAVKMYE